MTASHIPKKLRLSDFDRDRRTATFVASTTDYVLGWEPKRSDDGSESEQEVREAITEWTFERFLANPVILWAHDGNDLPIGTAESVEFDVATGLVVRIKFASERANPRAEQVWRAVDEGIVRAVSVGFDREILTEEIRDGVPHRTTRGDLTEISVVSVPADKRALVRGQTRARVGADGRLTEDREDTEEQKRAALSAAGKALASARKARNETVKFDASGRIDLSKFKRTPVGGLRIPARIARIGVLEYRNRDGSKRREYRSREEVSSPESLASFEDAPVIDFIHHTSLLTTEDATNKAVGHVKNVRMDGDYVVGELVINDAETIARIERGERTEISAGYRTKDQRSSGMWGGQTYDLVQTQIVGNHIALCPPSRGRSGPDVGLRLDIQDSDIWVATEIESMTTKIKLDGKDYEFGSEAHIGAVESIHAKALAAKDAEIASLRAASDTLKGKLDAADAKADDEAKKAAADEAAKEKLEEEKKSREKARMKRALRAARLMEVEDDEEKLDGLLAKSDREIMVEALKHIDPKFSKESESEDYLRARFDAIESERLDSVSINGLRAVRSIVSTGEDDAVAKARAEMIARNRNAWKNPRA